MPSTELVGSSDPLCNLRGEIDEAIGSGRAETASALLDELWRTRSSPATAAFVCSRYEKLRDRLPLTAHRTALLRSFTVEPLIPLLRAAAYYARIDLRVHVDDFNTYAQAILDENSSFYRFQPDSVFLAVRTADLAPDLWFDFTTLAAESVHQAVRRVSFSFEQWVAAFRQRSNAAFVVHTLEQPSYVSSGILDGQLQPAQADAIREINKHLARLAHQNPGVYLLDYDALVARHGRLDWQDEQKLLLARLPVAAPNLLHLAREWLRFLLPLSGRIAKVLVSDLDNTLWGGIIGEDGRAGIQLGAEYPGAAYLAVQRAMLDLSRRGILLAICSKNNPEDALEVIEKHPSMLLRPHNFAAMRISWRDKLEGLREIARELNVGIDALAFLDDNPVERELVRAALPEVAVIDLPNDPLAYAASLRNCPLFERLTLSGEDQQRTAMYRQQRERHQAENKFQSKEDFFYFLGQQAEILPLTPEDQPRIAQLTQKTNQFNLTTRRYSEQQISEMAARNECKIYSIRVRDRFGDHGIVGVAITLDQAQDCEIDTFLLSCRVIGRTVETALLSYVAEAARARGCQRLLGSFLPTKKNSPARDFYSQQGFATLAETPEGSRWALDLTRQSIVCPAWIKLTSKTENTIAAQHS
ncbi:MAG: HAD family hydrolase [Acidobacteria bacterium]|nr:HAD family hydrolase [Acidobacteriota bacterium]MBV9483087.1 HAD family hydrolase [Acidobacteriota bacterium]